MNDLPVITSRRLIKALKKLDFEVIRSKGSHNFLWHADGRCTTYRCMPVKLSVVISWLKSGETVKSLWKTSDKCYKRTSRWRVTGHISQR
ncbi:MAG: type II toxin-antitoxin system HicA family toxin [Desulfobacterales bacterium]